MPEKIIIQFKAEGAKELQAAMKSLANAQKKFNGSVKQSSSSVSKFSMRVKKNSQVARENSNMVNNLKSSIARYRNTILLASFASALFAKTVGKLTSLYAEQEAAEKKLEVALGTRSQALLDFASAQQQVTAYGDEATISAMSQAAAFTTNEQTIKNITIAAQNLAVAQGLGLDEAFKLVTKSIFTSRNSLK